MGFGGSVAAMISSIKYNRSIGHRKKSLRDKYKEFEVAQNKKPLEYKSTMSAEDKKAFRVKLIKDKRQSTIQISVIASIIVIVCISLFVMVILI
ncbi:MAG: Flp pilus assembly protein TadB [Salibacteraceae bacterium]|jgi:Flp pilus assembly protein TadB